MKNWRFWTVVLEKTLESPLDCKEIQPVHPKGDQSWIFIGTTVVEAETSIFWPLDVKSWLIWKDPEPGENWRQGEKGTTEDEMVGWHHRLNGHKFEWTPGVGDGQGGLVCCSPWGHKESDTTEWLNWTELNCENLEVRDWFMPKIVVVISWLYTWLQTLQVVYTSVFPTFFNTSDSFHESQLYHDHGPGVRGMVSGWFKYITFIVHCISNLMPLLIWQRSWSMAERLGTPSIQHLCTDFCGSKIFFNRKVELFIAKSKKDL